MEQNGAYEWNGIAPTNVSYYTNGVTRINGIVEPHVQIEQNYYTL